MAKRIKPKTLGDTLRAAIAESGLCPAEISRATRVPEATLSRFLRRERDLRLSTADRLVEFFSLALKK